MNPVYVYIDDECLEVHNQRHYHMNGSAFYVELEEPVLSLNLDGTDEQLHESLAKLGEWLAKRREEQA